MSSLKSTPRAFFLSILMALVATGCPPVEPPDPSLSVDFVATPTLGYGPLTVQFNDLSVSQTSTIDYWYWDFGDGRTSEEPSPQHTYMEPGSYSVSLYVEAGGEGLTMTKTNFIQVEPKPLEIGVSVPSHVFGTPRPWVSEVWNDREQGGALEWTATPSAPWILVEPASGRSEGPHDRVPLSISVDFERVVSPSDGYVELTAPGAESVRLSISAREGLNLSIRELRWGQSVLDRGIDLIANKPGVLWVDAEANYAMEGVPAVILRASRLGVELGSLDLNPPDVLPRSDAEERVPSAATGYHVQLPAAWVQPETQWTVELDMDRNYDEADHSDNIQIVEPEIVAGPVLALTVVPVIVEGTSATVPEFEQYVTEILPLESIQWQERAPYTFQGSLETFEGWETLLSELEQLRVADGSGDYYYGFIPGWSPLLGGLGYRGLPAAIGIDAYGAQETMAHELGHNFDLAHSPCVEFGTIYNVDPYYPHDNGVIGAVGYRHQTNEFFDPVSTYDLMSYCSPEWISDYSYLKAWDFLSVKATVNPSEKEASRRSENLLLISGALRDSSFSFNPIVRLTGTPAPPEAGPYRLRLHTPQSLVEVSFGLHEITCGDGESDATTFAFTIPDPGELDSVEIVGPTGLLYADAARHRSAKSANVALVEGKDDQLTVTWNADDYPYAFVAWRGESRVTLGLRLEGGLQSLSTVGLPEGGQWEVGLSGGLQTQSLVFSR